MSRPDAVEIEYLRRRLQEQTRATIERNQELDEERELRQRYFACAQRAQVECAELQERVVNLEGDLADAHALIREITDPKGA